MNFLKEHGFLFGALMIVLVTAGAILLGRKAATGVRQFREEHHESFLGVKKK